MVLKKNYEQGKKRVKKKRFTQQGDNIASEVTISYDPSLIKKRPKGDNRTAEEKRIDEEQERRMKAQASGSQMSGMGLEASMGKDERKFRLQSLIDKKEVVTLQSAMTAMSLAKGTIITYLKEMDLQLYDAKDNKFVGAKEGHRVGLDD